MAQLVSTWSKGVQSVPEDYILTPERRPADLVTVCKEIPVINLQNDRSEIIQQVLKACEEFGYFQVCLELTSCLYFRLIYVRLPSYLLVSRFLMLVNR